MNLQNTESSSTDQKLSPVPNLEQNVALYDWTKVEQALLLATRPFLPSELNQPSDSTIKPERTNRAFSEEEDSRKGFLKGRSSGASAVVAPGAVLLVGQSGKVVYHKAFGCRSIEPESSPLNRDTVYDVGDLTKVVVTTTLAMQLAERGQLNLDKRLSHIFQTFGSHGKERMTVRHLLNHTSGYPTTAPFYRQIIRADRGERAGFMASRGAVELIYNELFRSRLDNLPGKVTNYSELGFMLLGRAIESVSGSPLEKIALRNLIKPLKLASTGFIEFNLLRRQGVEPNLDLIAPTAVCPWRGRIVSGEVHEDNAWAMGGVAPHAGLFSNACDLYAFAATLLDCWHGRSKFVDREILRQFWSNDSSDAGTAVLSADEKPADGQAYDGWALGWATPATKGANVGKLFSASAVGINSYTGCSLWIDPVRELTVVLLSNCIHPSAGNARIQSFRPVIHDLVNEAIGAQGNIDGR